MPPRKRYLSRAQRGWTEAEIDQLRHGHDFLDDAFGIPSKSFDEESARQCWDELGEQITAEHIADKPGSRPWGWWRWEAPGPRRVVAGKPHPQDGHYPWSEPGSPKSYFYGKPACLYPTKDHAFACYETEADYLDRLNLLTEDERHALAVANITNMEN